jgi:HPr kinase/phosphorylase
MDIFGVGVFLTGNSGIGKSEIALGLISRGHRLIADDSAEFYLHPETTAVMGKCHEVLRNFLEVRGLGILNIKEMFGDHSIRDNASLQLVTHLADLSDEEIKNSDRLHGMYSTMTILGKDIARVVVPVAAGRNLSVLIESAVRSHRLRCNGYDAAQDFINRQRELLNCHEK